MKVRVLERDGGDEIDEPREVRRIDLELWRRSATVAGFPEFGSAAVWPGIVRLAASNAAFQSATVIDRRYRDVLELRVLLRHRLQRVVDEIAGGGNFITEHRHLACVFGVCCGFSILKKQVRHLCPFLVGGGPELFIELAEEGRGRGVGHVEKS